jgi:Asp-tRNA(Asn)/Glu-tRNA(Gln) amidotransferase A subunit family amidase
MSATDLCDTPATELLTLIRKKTLSTGESCRAVLERMNPKLNTASVAVTAFEVGRLNPAHSPPHAWDWFQWASFSDPFNCTGQPAASVPAGFTPAGMPVGVQIVGRCLADLAVLRASAAFEQARPWAALRSAVDSGETDHPCPS